MATTPAVSSEKQALIALRNMRRKIEEMERARTEPVAIVGIGCRYPGGVVDLDSFWRVLAGKVDAVKEIPPERFPVGDLFHPDPSHKGTTYSRWAGLVDGVDLFDAGFFGIAPREAVRCDPQQRLFLEAAWEALECAGIDPRSLAGTNTGVFAGVTLVEYAALRAKTLALTEYEAYDSASTAITGVSGRLSYFLGIHGPCMSIDTACSSSLTAIDRAVRSVREGESTLAIAGGVNVLSVPESLVTMSRWGMLAPDGRCKAFDASANGFVRGEGCGVLVLERLSDAIANNRRILAVIRGSAVNQDGPSSGLTAPNGLAQQMVIRQALKNSGVSPGDVSYVETHGTGTALGDPIEAEALGAVFSNGHSAAHPLLIGSVKTNFGHCESAAGVAGLIKVVLGLYHRTIPPQLHWREPSPHIRWSEMPLRVASEALPWEPVDGRRIAGVSAFGFTGTNVHIVLEESPAPDKPKELPPGRPIEVLTVSAKGSEALRELAGRYAQHVRSNLSESWKDVCHTSAAGRAHFGHRLSVRAEDSAQGLAALESYLTGQPSPAVAEGVVSASPKIAFLYTGQGSQYAGMGRSLYECSAVFKEAVDRCDAILEGELPVLPGALIHGEHPDAEKLIVQTIYTQPVLFAFEYALDRFWRSLGVEPTVGLGHSVGEFVAAAGAGMMSFEDGLKLVAARAKLMHSVKADGAMLAAEVSEVEAREALSGFEHQVSVAAVNGVRQTVISGLRSAVEATKARLDAKGTQSKWLRVSQAFHSPLLDGICGEFERRASETIFGAPNIQVLSNVTGGLLDEVSGRYWADHMRQPVRFYDQVETLRGLGCNVLLEIGPRPVLIGLAQQSAKDSNERVIASFRAGASEWESIVRAAQELDAAGVDLDWKAWDRGHARKTVSLPFYAFQRERYWIEPSAHSASQRTAKRTAETTGSPLLGAKLASALPQTQFESHIAAQGDTAWIADHRIEDKVILPATGFLELMASAASQALGEEWREIRDAVFLRPLEIAEADGCTVQTIVDQPENGKARVRVFSLAGKCWELHAEAVAASVRNEESLQQAVGDVSANCESASSVDEFYATLRAAGVNFGAAFRSIEELRLGEGESWGKLTVVPGSGYGIHPATLDACLQVASASLLASGSTQGELFLPLSAGCFRLLPSFKEEERFFTCHAHVTGAMEVRIELRGSHGELRAVLEKVRFGRVKRETDASGCLYRVEFVPRPVPASAPKPVAGTNWLLLADQGGIAVRLAEKLTAAGASCTLAFPGAGQWERLLNSTNEKLDGILHLWTLDQPGFESLNSPEHLLAEQLPGYGTCLALSQMCSRKQIRPEYGVWFVTRRSSAASAPVWALRRTLVAESPELSCYAFDLDADRWEDAQIDALIAELGRGDEKELAVRDGKLCVARLQRMPRAEEQDNSAKRQLIPSSSGRLDDLTFERRPRVTPGPKEVEIEPRATGLNFRDILNAMGMMPGSPAILGAECAGVVVRAGEASGFSPGDEVIAFAAGAFANYVTALAANTVLKPVEVTFEQAATLPVAYMTAIYALETLAQLKRGESVLIHAGAGGLGIAAIRVAKAAGADIHATAGSDSKREFLRSLGVQYVYNSRSLDFATQLMTATAGRGVDVVLNSLAGEFIEKSLSVTAQGGRFLEVGKRGILTSQQAFALRPDVAYFAFDLGEEGLKDETVIPALMRRVASGVKRGALPPLPLMTVPFEDASQGFRRMAQAKHTGKIVATFRAAPRPLRIDGKATYLITGGLGAIGLEAARWLVKQGARSLVLCSRRSANERQARAIEGLKAEGASVRLLAADCGDRNQMAALLASIPADAPLRGVLHAAGVVEDALLPEQSFASFERTALPKAIGAWNLHELTRNLHLDIFLMFSSASAVLGSPGQANYAASNALLDAIAVHRRALGLPALTINWGPWEGGGMALQGTAGRRMGGFDLITPETGFSIVEQLAGSSAIQAAVIPIRRWEDLPGRDITRDPFFSLIHRQAESSHSSTKRSVKSEDLLKNALAAESSASSRRKMLLHHVAGHAARVLGLPPARRIEEGAALHDLGLDSLMAVELRNAVNFSVGVSLPATVVLDYPTLGALTDYILVSLFGASPETASGTASAPPKGLSEIAALADAEAEALLAAELGMTNYAAKR